MTEQAEPGTQYWLVVLCDIWTLNAERRMHWRKHGELTSNMRFAAKIEAMQAKLPHFDRVSITAEPIQPKGVLADPGAHEPAVKAIIDGLRDARVLDDDTGKYVANIDSLPPVRGPKAGIRLILTPAKLIV